jgi:hypothetical protein
LDSQAGAFLWCGVRQSHRAEPTEQPPDLKQVLYFDSLVLDLCCGFPILWLWKKQSHKLVFHHFCLKCWFGAGLLESVTSSIVDISLEKMVSHLKCKIKKERPVDLRDVDTDRLTL